MIENTAVKITDPPRITFNWICPYCHEGNRLSNYPVSLYRTFSNNMPVEKCRNCGNAVTLKLPPAESWEK